MPTEKGAVLEEREDGPAHPRKPQRGRNKGGVGSGRGLRTGKMIQDVCPNPDLPHPTHSLSLPQGQATALPTQTLRKQGIHTSLSIAIRFSRSLPDPGLELGVSCTAGGFFAGFPATQEGMKGKAFILADEGNQSIHTVPLSAH